MKGRDGERARETEQMWNRDDARAVSHGERHQHAPCYARTTRFCRRCCPRLPSSLALARLCISVIRPFGSYPRLCRAAERIWRTTYAPQTMHMHIYTCTHIHKRNGESPYGLSSGVVALATVPSFALSPLLFLIGLCPLPLSLPLHSSPSCTRLWHFAF